MTDTNPVDTVMRALSDPTRRAVFERIATAGEVTVSELTQGSGVSQGAISQHLKTLKSAGLVVDRAQGRHVHYRVDTGGLVPLAAWMDHYAVFWRDRFKDLRTLLQDIDQ
jgi:DNA-binding transcriptional ArsR family regulator